jgi:hypothetical protein
MIVDRQFRTSGWAFREEYFVGLEPGDTLMGMRHGVKLEAADSRG